MDKQHITLICQKLSLKERSVKNTIGLLQEGATVPFIARYRKEVTGALDEVEIGAVKKELYRLEELEKRKATILTSIKEQGKLTDILKERILNNYDATSLEDLYLPYKKKRKTRASVAKEKGLEPLAKKIFEQQYITDIEGLAKKYIRKDVETIEIALQGARDIIAEWINEDENARNSVRKSFEYNATIHSKVARGKKEDGIKYKDYFEFEEALKRIPSHRLLAIRRGEEEGFLRVRIAPPKEDTLYRLERKIVDGNKAGAQQVKLALHDCYNRLLCPSIETEYRKISKEKADTESIAVFADNLEQLLLAPPLGQKKILAIDPGYRTGCKVVCLNAAGDLLENTTIYPHPPQNDSFGARDILKNLVYKYKIEAIAIGNGTASRETAALTKKVNFDKKMEVFVVSESGASIYSASDIAREEFPHHDVTVRGAISIGRRLMDPLAELVKIDAKSIGVGQYQHDVNQVMLKERLDTVVESCVNAVGINLNTASKHLLTYISGLGPKLAQNIVDYRSTNGAFSSRDELRNVSRMGDKAYEQAAGFLRIREAKNPLDNTAVHPESYHIVHQMAQDLDCSIVDLIENAVLRKKIDLEQYTSNAVGLLTLKDIISELSKPGLDPRGEVKAFNFSEKIQTIEDLKEGMIVPGIISNITKFGAFVDIGIKESGLVHISQLANKFIKEPTEVVKLQQKVQVKILEIDIKRGRVALSMKEV